MFSQKTDGVKRKPAVRRKIDYDAIGRKTKDAADVPTTTGYTAAFKGKGKKKKKGKGKGKGKGKKSTKDKASADSSSVGADAGSSSEVPRAKPKAKAKGKAKRTLAGPFRRLRRKTSRTESGCDVEPPALSGLRAADLTTKVILQTPPSAFATQKEKTAAGNKVCSAAFRRMERKLTESPGGLFVTAIKERSVKAGNDAKSAWAANHLMAALKSDESRISERVKK